MSPPRRVHEMQNPSPPRCYVSGDDQPSGDAVDLGVDDEGVVVVGDRLDALERASICVSIADPVREVLGLQLEVDQPRRFITAHSPRRGTETSASASSMIPGEK